MSSARARRPLIALAMLLGFGAAAQAREPPDPPPPPEEGEAEAADRDATDPPSPPRAAYEGTASQIARLPHVRLRSFGRSAAGRSLDVLTIRSSHDGDEAPIAWSALVVAHAEARRGAVEVRAALDLAAELAQHAPGLPAGCAVHVVPDLNPDWSAGGPLRVGNDTPRDDDRDGERDEDGPDDVDGDGQVGWMAVPDPGGNVHVAEEDGAVTVAWVDAEDGKTATHRLVPEGRDDDGDGLLNEDGPGGVDVGRNLTWRFDENAPHAGEWAASESESRALMDLLLADETIALVYEIGGAQTVAGDGGHDDVWRKPSGADDATARLLRSLHPLPDGDKPGQSAPVSGSVGATTVHQLGRLWMGRSIGRAPGRPWPHEGSDWPDGMTWRRIEGTGRHVAGATFVANVPDEPVVPTPLVDDAREFLVAAAAARGRTVFVDTSADGGPGVLRLRTRIANPGRLPTHSERGAEVRGRRPLNVRVSLPDGATLLAGKPLVQIERIAAGERSDELAWVVTGPSGAEVRVTCTGPDTGTVEIVERVP